jgi:ribosomal protein L29
MKRPRGKGRVWRRGEAGFDKAFSAILDGNLTTLITAVIMIILGTGPVKGFGVTLTIGIFSTMAIIKKKDLRGMAPNALATKLAEVRRELNTERGLIKSGGRSSNPGKIKELRKTIARILTYHSQKMALVPAKKMPAPIAKKKHEVKSSA